MTLRFGRLRAMRISINSDLEPIEALRLLREAGFEPWGGGRLGQDRFVVIDGSRVPRALQILRSLGIDATPRYEVFRGAKDSDRNVHGSSTRQARACTLCGQRPASIREL